MQYLEVLIRQFVREVEAGLVFSDESFPEHLKIWFRIDVGITKVYKITDIL
jgi:hypothetical protein